ncbi:hypothetical protein [Flexithrix dorotheae]|uniref:hypothetical protein n=1 Tax=Flexithrix dorotheae TaxID=70993 RepID=UPI00037B62FC|nr:hypothetical protein [Flexithrix dorotheae]
MLKKIYENIEDGDLLEAKKLLREQMRINSERAKKYQRKKRRLEALKKDKQK